MRVRWLERLACAALLLAVCSRVHAFQSPSRFLADAVEEGGSSGTRFFTGSPADGYTCKVCHTQGEPVHVSVSGIPVEGYVPGRTYPIVIDWQDDLKAVGLNAEITDSSGAALGQLVAPPATQLTAADLCSVGMLSGAVIAPVPPRSVAMLGECGQHQTTLAWTAPASGPPGAAWFSGSLVVSDGNGDVKGDRVTDFRRALSPVGASQPIVTSNASAAGCGVVRLGQCDRHSFAACFAAVVLGWLVQRRLTSTRRTAS